MRTRRRLDDLTGLLPFPPAAATAAIRRPRPVLQLPRPVLQLPRPPVRRVTREITREITRELVAELRPPIAHASAMVRSRRFGFYLDIFGATLFMALFVAAAILA